MMSIVFMLSQLSNEHYGGLNRENWNNSKVVCNVTAASPVISNVYLLLIGNFANFKQVVLKLKLN